MSNDLKVYTGESGGAAEELGIDSWGKMIKRSGRENRRAHVGKQLSWSTRPAAFPDIPSAMPSKARLSPVGDIGEWKQKEALAVFPALKKMTDHVKRSSHKIPAPKGWVK